MAAILNLLKKKTAISQTIPMQTAIGNCKYVVIDTELTGLNPKKDSIVSIGCIKMTGSKIELGNTFYKVVKPITALTSKSVLVHGITPTEAAEGPLIGNVIDDFLSFCKECVVVGHFISIDLAFINMEMKRLSYRTFDNPVVDTSKIYEWIEHQNGDFSRYFREDSGKDLFSIAKNYKIEITEAHNALWDAFITAQIFQRFLWHLMNLGVKTIKELLIIGRP